VFKRQRVAGWLDRAGVVELILRARARLPSPWVTALAYHSIRATDHDGRFDAGVVDSTAELFDRQVATLKRYFTLIGTDELRRHLAGEKLPPNPAIITLDDGYRDNHDIALPILKRHGVKATFFISTAYVGERRIFWWDRIAYLLRHSRRERITLEEPVPLVLDLSCGIERALQAALRVVKDHYNLDLDHFLERLGAAAEVAWNAALESRFAEELVMTWDHVRALRSAGMEIQSHTRTHRVLQTLTPVGLKQELERSRADLEGALGEPVHALSYPVGRSIANEPAIRAAVAHAGYTIAFSNETGINRLGRRGFDPLNLRRLKTGLDLSEYHFRGILALPQLAF
jgi:peptidoglycan/xylan/chitin deacetylase (PgdA/CDA1 family)